MEISIQDLLELLSYVSNVTVLEYYLINALQGEGKQFEARQLMALGERARSILKQLDQQYPAILPIPHDGIPWAER